jgi:hypothetical protein
VLLVPAVIGDLAVGWNLPGADLAFTTDTKSPLFPDSGVLLSVLFHWIKRARGRQRETRVAVVTATAG